MPVALLRLLGLILLTLTMTSGTGRDAGVALPGWAGVVSDVPADPRVSYGALADGMRYALLPNRQPAGQIAIRFAVDFGSLDEADDERGLAHVIEHMAFNGSTHVAEGEMVKRFERLGMSFGPDINAETNRTTTVYSLDLPDGGEQRVGEALFLLREVASELTFTKDALEREKGVVLAELRENDTPAQRRSEARNAFLLPGSRAAARSPGGDPAIVAAADRAQLVSLYDRFYRPERTVLVVAGDFEVTAMARLLEHTFGSWRGRGPAGPKRGAGYTPPARPASAQIIRDEAGENAIAVYQLSPYDNPPDSVAYRQEADMYAVGSGIVAKRFARLAEQQEPPFQSAGLAYASVLDAADAAVGSVATRPGKWSEGLEALEQEWRRALLFGFTQDEIDAQVDALLAARRTAALSEEARSTSQLAAALLTSVLDDRAFAPPLNGLQRLEAERPIMTANAVSAVFRKHLAVGTPQFVVATTTAEPRDAAEVIKAWEASRKIGVQPRAVPALAPFAYTSFGKPGVVSADRRMTSIDTRMVTFANNVRLNIKRTEFEKNVVRVSIRIAGGEAGLGDAPTGLLSLMQAFPLGGLEAHSYEDLRELASGHAVQLGLGASSASFGGSYVTTPADLEFQLQIAAAYLTHPGYRPEGERRWREATVAGWTMATQNAQNVLATRGMRLLAGGDRRVGADPSDAGFARSFVELKAWLQPYLDQGAIEIAIVGDVDEATAIDAVARTFGAFPPRASVWTSYQSPKPLRFQSSSRPIVLRHHGEANQVLVSLFWPVAIDPDKDPQGVRTLSAMVSVLQIKLTDRIREQLGVSYSPSAGALVSSIYPGWGYVYAAAEIRPQDVDAATAALREAASGLRGGAVSDDEFKRAVGPALEQLPAHASMNAYWLALIAEAQTRPDRLSQARLEAVTAGWRKITPADAIAAAKRWLTTDATLVRIEPESDDPSTRKP